MRLDVLSRTALSVVRALTELAGLPAGEYSGAAAVAERIGAPPNYLSKLLKGLVREGLVESQKGSGGGFRLSRHPARISLFDIVEPIDQVSRWDGCFLGGRCHPNSACNVHLRWESVRRSYLEFLQETTIAELGG